MSLKTKLTLFNFFAFTGVMVILVTTLVCLGLVEFRRMIRNDLQFVSEQIKGELSVEDSNPQKLLDQIPMELVYQLWDADGKLIESSPQMESQVLESAALSRQNEVSFNKTRLDSEPIFILTTPIESEVGGINYLQVGMGISHHHDSIIRIVWFVSGGILLSGAIFSYCWWMVLNHFSKSLHDLGEMTQEIGNISSSAFPSNFDLSFEGSFKDLAQTIQQTREKLAQIFRSHNQFLGAITHDLRTPLTVIKGNIGLMRKMQQIDNESLDAMEEEADRLDRLVNDLLVITQSESGEFSIIKKPVRFDTILNGCIKQLRVLDQDEHQITLDSVEEVIVDGNEDRLKQVVMNLGMNAIKYTPPQGKIRFGMRRMQANMFFWVADTGEGIPDGELSNVFAWNFSGSNAQTYRAQERSFGLGLYITNSIVKLHGGHIEVESQAGVGTTFYVWLPVMQAEDEDKT